MSKVKIYFFNFYLIRIIQPCVYVYALVHVYIHIYRQKLPFLFTSTFNLEFKEYPVINPVIIITISKIHAILICHLEIQFDSTHISLAIFTRFSPKAQRVMLNQPRLFDVPYRYVGI